MNEQSPFNSDLNQAHMEALETGENAEIDRVIAHYYDEHRSQMLGYVSRMMGQSTSENSEIEVIVQEAIVKTLQAAKKNQIKTHLQGYVFRVLRNLVIDYFRKEKNISDTSFDDFENMVDSKITPQEAYLAVELKQELIRAIRHLTDEQAEVIQLRFLEGYSIEEVADMMNKTVGSIKALQYRAVATLKQFLQQKKEDFID